MPMAAAYLFIDKIDGPACTYCGCRDVEVRKEPDPDEWFASGIAVCNHCSRQFVYMHHNEEQEEARVGSGVVFQRVKCPVCKSKDVPVKSTVDRIRYHKCRDCGRNFKSVEK
jgi:hypothetical protein